MLRYVPKGLIDLRDPSLQRIIRPTRTIRQDRILMDDRTELIARVLSCSGSLFRSLHPAHNPAWLTVELTMPQLKALVCVAQGEAATSGTVARRLGVGLSPITGLVDRLAEQGLVVRRDEPYDRRITRITPTPRGH